MLIGYNDGVLPMYRAKMALSQALSLRAAQKVAIGDVERWKIANIFFCECDHDFGVPDANH